MTTFSDIRYSVAWKEGQRQQTIMDEVMAMDDIESKWDSTEVEEKMLELA
jgi:kynurenine 3-monooxygenase